MIRIRKIEKSCEKSFVLATGIVCLLFLLVQYQAVFLHFDDFGYGCLNYGYNGNEHGMAWTITDLCRFMKWHYLSWGGRVLFLSLLTLALRIGEQFLQIFQPLIIWGLCLCIYELIKRKEYDWIAAVLSVLVLGSIGRMAAVDGIYWYTASCLYVWPFLVFFRVILLLHRTKRAQNKKFAAILILTFIAGFSQEQVAVIVVISLGGAVILKRLLHEHVDRQLLFATTAGTLGALIVIFAPGNFVRSAAYADLSSLSLFEKVIINTARIFIKVFDRSNFAVILLWLIVLQLLGFSLGKEEKIPFAKYLKSLNILSSIVFLAVWVFCYSILFKLCIFFTISGLLLAENVLYYLIRKDTLPLALLAGAICSLGMMVFAPSFDGRSSIPFFVVVNLLEVNVLREELFHVRYHWTVQIVPIFLCMVTLTNLLYLTIGLYRNREVNLINHVKLIENSKLTDLGEQVPTVQLYRVPDDRFTVTMPYWPDGEKIDSWLRHYYKLPEEIQLNYRSFEYEHTISE